MPRLLASPETSAEQVVESAIDALQPEETRLIQEASIEPTIQMFNDIYDVVLSDDPYQVPLSYGAQMQRAEGKIDRFKSHDSPAFSMEATMLAG